LINRNEDGANNTILAIVAPLLSQIVNVGATEYEEEIVAYPATNWPDMHWMCNNAGSRSSN